MVENSNRHVSVHVMFNIQLDMASLMGFGDMTKLGQACVQHRLSGMLHSRDDSHMTITVLDMEVAGVRPRGKPKLRYVCTPSEETRRRIG